MTKYETMPAVLHVTSGGGVGGVEKVIMSLVGELKERNWPVVVACKTGSWVHSQLSDTDIPVIPIPMHRGIAASIFDLPKLRKIIKKHKIGIIHTHSKRDSLLALPEAKRQGLPSICTVHNLYAGTYCRLADKIIAVSNAVKSDLTANGTDANDITVVRNGIVLSDLPPIGSDFRAQNGFSPDDILVGTVGRLVPQKGIDLLIKSMIYCSKVKLLIAGYGKPEYEAELKALVTSTGIENRVFFLGPIDDPTPMLASLDVFVLASMEEGLPIAILEAMHAGVPIVATKVGGVPEVIINDKTGVLIPPGDVKALSDGMNRLITDKDLAEYCSYNAKMLVTTNCSASRMADDVIDIYQSAFLGM